MLYFKLKSNIIFRNYESFGYITDNRNFGYRYLNNNERDIGDKIVSQSGAVFLSVLGKKPQALGSLARKISRIYGNEDIERITDDIKEFYFLLESEGFIASGSTLRECNDKDVEYSQETPESKDSARTLITGYKENTQDFFNEYFQNEPQLTSIHIEITGKCNEKCVHCYIPHDNTNASHMDSVLFFDILEQCIEMKLLHITLSGGEPMMHNDFVSFLKKCNDCNFSVNVLSNLSLINNTIVNEMKRNRLLSVQTSLYSMDGDIHDAITRVKGSYEKTKNAILLLKENDIPMQINCPIIKQNIDCYNDVIAWGTANSINVSSDYDIIAEYNQSNMNLRSRLSINDIRSIMCQRLANEPSYLKKLEEEAKEKENMSPDDNICSVCRSSICVAYNGEVFPCVAWQNYTVGNISDTSLNEIWNNSIEIQYLRNLRRRDFPKCIQCPDSNYCTLCMVRNANEHPLGNPLAVNGYYCSIAKLTKTMVTERKAN